MAPGVDEIAKLRSKVEDEKAQIECNVTGFPIPKIVWLKKLEGEGKNSSYIITIQLPHRPPQSAYIFVQTLATCIIASTYVNIVVGMMS